MYVFGLLVLRLKGPPSSAPCAPGNPHCRLVLFLGGLLQLLNQGEGLRLTWELLKDSVFTPTLEKLYIHNIYINRIAFFLSLTKTSPYLFMAASGLSYGTWASL